ncbi:GTP-binding protein, partial [Rhyzopertha dominica]
MVFIVKALFSNVIKTKRRYLREGFKDSLRIYVKGGSGGNGYPKYMFGGVGGQGGNVIVVAKENLTLSDVEKANQRKRYLASHGRDSTHNFILGTPGESLKFEVPVGVTIYTEHGKKLGELNKEGEELVIAKGGTGGHRNNGFLGTKGQAYPVLLDLKLIADIGLVGFPNAGKSTLLKAISDAKPKIASYPFTTIKPNIGKIIYKDFRQISMADLPGLIEGAHVNKGMGHSFLRHVERTKLLLLVVDINGFQLSPNYPHRSAMETVLLLNKELELYNEELLGKPAMLLINKIDTEGAVEKYKEIKDCLHNLSGVLSNFTEEIRPTLPLKFDEVMAISAKHRGNDIELLKEKLRKLLDSYAELNGEDKVDMDNLYNNLRESVREKGPNLQLKSVKIKGWKCYLVKCFSWCIIEALTKQNKSVNILRNSQKAMTSADKQDEKWKLQCTVIHACCECMSFHVMYRYKWL